MITKRTIKGSITNPSRNEAGWKVAPSLVAVAAALLASFATVTAVASDSPFPVPVSTNGRYLEDANGTPFPFHGDNGKGTIDWMY
jgi:hypothetical protein